MTAELSGFASKLAAAVARRHALDEIADTGESVPPQLMQAAEGDIRAAEGALMQARATFDTASAALEAHSGYWFPDGTPDPAAVREGFRLHDASFAAMRAWVAATVPK